MPEAVGDLEHFLDRTEGALGKAPRHRYLVAVCGERLPFADATFYALTFTYLLRYVADPQATLAELARA